MYSAKPYEKKRKSQPKRRERKPFAPPIRCVIVNAVTGERIGYDRLLKSIVYFSLPHVFPSHNSAKQALWHVCKDLPKKKTPSEPDRYIIVKGV